jgi:hypothetical protein
VDSEGVDLLAKCVEPGKDCVGKAVFGIERSEAMKMRLSGLALLRRREKTGGKKKRIERSYMKLKTLRRSRSYNQHCPLFPAIIRVVLLFSSFLPLRPSLNVADRVAGSRQQSHPGWGLHHPKPRASP